MDPISRLCREFPAACRAAGMSAQIPVFAFAADGPDHAPTFRATCHIPRGPELGWPAALEGPPAGSKREAKTLAAAAVLRAAGQAEAPGAGARACFDAWLEEARVALDRLLADPGRVDPDRLDDLTAEECRALWRIAVDRP